MPTDAQRRIGGVPMSVERKVTSQALSRRELVERLFGAGASALAAALSGGASVASLATAPPARAAVQDGGIPTKRKFRYGMVIDTRRCVGCRACVVACKAENKTPPGVSYTVVVEEAVANRFDDKPIFMTKPCFHCEKPPCVDVCPVSATFKRERDGIVVIDYDRCIGCRYCITGCPYGAPVRAPSACTSRTPRAATTRPPAAGRRARRRAPAARSSSATSTIRTARCRNSCASGSRCGSRKRSAPSRTSTTCCEECAMTTTGLKRVFWFSGAVLLLMGAIGWYDRL